MMTVSKKISIKALIGLGVVGILAYLAMQPITKPSSAIRDTSGEVLNATVSGNEQEGEVRVNGQPVPLDSAGSAHVPVANGKGSVTVTDNGKTVTTHTDNSVSSSTGGGSLNINVSTQSNGGSNFSNTYLHTSSQNGSAVHSSTNTNVHTSGTGNVQVTTTP